MPEATTRKFGTPDRPILLIGAAGMLGRAWRQLLDEHGLVHATTTRAELDITDPSSVDATIVPEHTVVINCAAYTNVDGAEADEDTAHAVNATGVGHLARRCAQTGSLLVHYSTDYVFDGHGKTTYPTDAPHGPINAYGRTKSAGESRVVESGCEHLIVRTSWLYAPWASNFVRTIARLAIERDDLSVVNDQHGRPTSTEHLARATLGLIDHAARGAFHATDGGVCTWFDFATEIARLTGSACRVAPCTTADMPRPAPRPAYSVLDLSATEAAIGTMPSWRDNLADVVNRLE